MRRPATSAFPAGPEQAPVHGEPGEGAHVELGADGVAQAVEDPDPGQLGLGEIRAGGGELGPPLRVEAALQVCTSRMFSASARSPAGVEVAWAQI